NTHADSAINRYTADDAERDSVFDVYAVTQQHHLDVDINDIHELLQPTKGKFELKDYEKVFSAEVTNGLLLGNIPGLEATQDIYQLRGIDRSKGAVVIVRPDQYIGHILPLDEFAAFDDYFATCLLEVHVTVSSLLSRARCFEPSVGGQRALLYGGEQSSRRSSDGERSRTFNLHI